jgi:hypothetical protein
MFRLPIAIGIDVLGVGAACGFGRLVLGNGVHNEWTGENKALWT